MSSIIDISGRDQDAEYRLLIYSFVSNQTSIPVSPDAKYIANLTINGVEVDFKAVAEYVMERYSSMLDRRAAEISQELLAGKTQEVEDQCHALSNTLKESRQALRDHIRKTFPNHQLSDDD